jgi:hypothetical protein
MTFHDTYLGWRGLAEKGARLNGYTKINTRLQNLQKPLMRSLENTTCIFEGQSRQRNVAWNRNQTFEEHNGPKRSVPTPRKYNINTQPGAVLHQFPLIRGFRS